jgi:hypothetical protein
VRSYLFLATHNSFTLSRSENQHLIDQMNFIADISSNRNLHSDKLRIKSSVNDLSELAKTADLGGQALEVDEFVFWGWGGHFGVFGVKRRRGVEGTVEERTECGEWFAGGQEAGWGG